MDSTPETLFQLTLDKKENLYRTIENRISALVDLWKKAQGLPIPSPADSPEVVNKDRVLLRGVFESTMIQNPQRADKYKRFREFDRLISEKQKQLDQEENTEEDDALELLLISRNNEFEDPDVQFLASLDNGTQKTLEQRGVIRMILKKIGTDGKIHSSYLPKEYEKLLQSPLRIWPQRFSIGVVVDEADYGPFMYKKFGHNRSLAIHPSGSVWSIVREKSPFEDGYQGDLSELNDEEFEALERKVHAQELQHEDFHAFAHEFLPQNIHSLPIFTRMKKSVVRLNKLKELPGVPQTIINREVNLLKSELDLLIDSDRDELIAEFVSIEDRSDRPSNTFASYIQKKRSFLRDFKGINLELDGKIDKALRILDIQALRDKIKFLYEQIKTKAPEKRESLDAAFVLFPISQIRHIERLVKRWVGDTVSEENT